MLQRSGQHVSNLDETTRVVNVDLEAKYFGRIKSELRLQLSYIEICILFVMLVWPDDMISQLSGEKYINVETYRKSGRIVNTTVWFIDFRGRICFRTDPNSGKVGRIKNNPNVRIAPSDIRGHVKGKPIEGVANLQNDTEYETINSMLNKKYGFMGVLVRLMYKLRNIKPMIVSVQLLDPTNKRDQ